jgi:hypothetical protein
MEIKKGWFENQNIFNNNTPNQGGHRFHSVDYLMQFQFEYTHLEYTIQLLYYINPE